MYSNNEVKITPVIRDIQTSLGSSRTINATQNSCNVTGFSGEIEKIYQGNDGAGVNPITFFILKDGKEIKIWNGWKQCNTLLLLKSILSISNNLFKVY